MPAQDPEPGQDPTAQLLQALGVPALSPGALSGLARQIGVIEAALERQDLPAGARAVLHGHLALARQLGHVAVHHQALAIHAFERRFRQARADDLGVALADLPLAEALLRLAGEE